MADGNAISGVGTQGSFSPFIREKKILEDDYALQKGTEASPEFSKSTWSNEYYLTTRVFCCITGGVLC